MFSSVFPDHSGDMKPFILVVYKFDGVPSSRRVCVRKALTLLVVVRQKVHDHTNGAGHFGLILRHSEFEFEFEFTSERH